MTTKLKAIIGYKAPIAKYGSQAQAILITKTNLDHSKKLKETQPDGFSIQILFTRPE